MPAGRPWHRPWNSILDGIPNGVLSSGFRVLLLKGVHILLQQILTAVACKHVKLPHQEAYHQIGLIEGKRAEAAEHPMAEVSSKGHKDSIPRVTPSAMRKQHSKERELEGQTNRGQ